MEFFAVVEQSDLDVQRLQSLLTIDRLPALCASIDEVLSHDGDRGVIYCLWGQFDVIRGELFNGVRFFLPDCPNALGWTITRDDACGALVVHCTIDKKTHEADFVASIEQFVADWASGLAGAAGSGRADRPGSR